MTKPSFLDAKTTEENENLSEIAPIKKNKKIGVKSLFNISRRLLTSGAWLASHKSRIKIPKKHLRTEVRYVIAVASFGEIS